MASWWVEYVWEAANYLSDNGELIGPLFFAMEALGDDEALRLAGVATGVPDLYVLILAQHEVFYTFDAEAETVTVVAIKPLIDDVY